MSLFFHLTIKIVFDRLFFQERVIAAKVSIYCVVSSLYLCFFLQKNEHTDMQQEKQRHTRQCDQSTSRGK